MIDGIKCSCISFDADLWRNNPLLDFGIYLSESTGEILSPKIEAKRRGLRFAISPQQGGQMACSITGSLHKYHNANDTNYNAYTFADISTTLSDLECNFKVDLSTAVIHSLEIGVNIPLDYSPQIILKNAICHKGKAFDSLDTHNKRVGIICSHTDYSVKLYDKGYQSKIEELDKYVLRYELKIHRQRILKPFGVLTLADLNNVEKVTPLIMLLWERLSEIVFFDFSFKGLNLSESKRLNWERYSNPNYWADLNRREYYKARKRHAELLSKYNCINWQKFVLKHTTKIWFELSQIKQKKGRRFPQYFNALVSTKKGTFSNLEYMLENVPTRDVVKRRKKEIEKKPIYCISCGRQITHQKRGSIFCSEKLYGVQAKMCRNKDSNRRLTIKRKIYNAMEKDLMLRITYRDAAGSQYTDTLGAKEIHVTREWLNRVISVEVLKPQPVILKTSHAKTYLQKVSNVNSENT